MRRGLLAAVGALVGPALLARTHAEQLLAEARARPVAPGPFGLPPLPYAFGALAPHFDARTMEIHHDAHHKTYVSRLNEALANTPRANLTLEQLCATASQLPDAVRNNAGGHYNHSLFWPQLAAAGVGGGLPTGPLAAALTRDFTSFNQFKAEFTAVATGRFGSGWAWLNCDPAGKLFVSGTPNQDNPLMDLPGIRRGTPLLGLDVWEHAYYLQYQNKRADYVAAFWQVVNWPWVGQLFAKAAQE